MDQHTHQSICQKLGHIVHQVRYSYSSGEVPISAGMCEPNIPVLSRALALLGVGAITESLSRTQIFHRHYRAKTWVDGTLDFGRTIVKDGPILKPVYYVQKMF